MRCPKCGEQDDKVIDSRSSSDGAQIRRRRECLDCGTRFTTYEQVFHEPMRVKKRTGDYQEFDRRKLRAGIERACEKRPVSTEQIEATVERIMTELENEHGREVNSEQIGERVMKHLRKLDEIAYVRFASVYRQFHDAEQFIHEIQRMTKSPVRGARETMIQLREEIAWVRDAGGQRTPFDNARLAASVHGAVALAGIADDLLAESVAMAVYLYTVESLPARTIAATEIVDLVVGLLTMLGLDDIGRLYEQRSQWAEIRLDRLAGAAVFELGFYRQLGNELLAVVDDDLELVQLRGLRACVMQLRGARRWGASCRVLADDIVGFVRERVRQASRTGTLCVEVTE